MLLSSKQRKVLEGLAHHLDPVVWIGKHGVTDNLVQAVRENLEAQELVKVKVLENATIERPTVASLLVEKTGATLIRIIGRIIILYRANPDKKHPIEVSGEPPSAGSRDESSRRASGRRVGTRSSPRQRVTSRQGGKRRGGGFADERPAARSASAGATARRARRKGRPPSAADGDRESSGAARFIRAESAVATEPGSRPPRQTPCPPRKTGRGAPTPRRERSGRTPSHPKGSRNSGR